MKEYTATLSPLKAANVSLIQPPAPAPHLQDVQQTGKHAGLHHGYAVGKIQTLRFSTGQGPQVLQQIN